MTLGIAQKLWAELGKQQVDVKPFDPPLEWLDRLPRRVKTDKNPDGDLPEGLFETDGKVALREVNRQRLGQLFLCYRRTLGGHALRGFLPRIVQGPQDVNAARAWGPVTAGPWVRAADAPEVATVHAQESLRGHLETAARLHGAALVALGVCTWADVKADGIRQWSRACDTLEAEDQERRQSA